MSKNYCPYCMTPVSENESCSVCGLTSGTYISSPHHLPPGTVLMDRYLVGRVLGEGGFGITYIGCDLRLELKVAIKEYYPVDRATRNASSSLEVTNFIGPSAKSFERGKQKFLGEAQVMARMDKQQAIVSVRDFFELNNTAYIVMEYIEGITFRELVEKKGGKIDADELFPMIEPLFHALTIMHENGLIHRDISPDNLMLENGKIRLLDFGCAREASRGTETMTIALKHGYAPIEQYQQKGQGPWTDIYALSATIYYCLTGKVPPQALDRITEDDLLLPSKLGVHLSASQEKALLKGMKLQPNRRFSSAEEMWRTLYAQPEEEKENDTAPDSADEQADAAKINKKTDMPAYEPIMKTEMGEIGTDREDKTSSDDLKEDTAEEPAVEKGAAEEKTDADEKNDAPGIDMEEKAGIADKPTESEIKKITFGRQQRIFLGAGIAAVCIVVIFMIWINRRPAGENAQEAINTNTQGASGYSEPQNDTAGSSETAGPVEIDPHIFDNAYIFTSGEGEEFDELMADDSIEAVIIDCPNMFGSRAVITKPVLLSKDTFWSADNLIITEGGYLQVEGNLDMSYSGYLRMYGDSLCFYVTDGGIFQSNNAFVWLNDAACFAMEGDNGGIDSPLEHRLIFSEDVFEQNNVYSVTDYASLKRAIEAGGPISIDADIVIEDYVDLTVPVRISENVTVSTMRQHEEDYVMNVRRGCVLVNHGTLEESLYVCDGGTVINDGVMSDTSAFWIENESTLINLGTMYADYTSRLWENALLVNIGELICRQFVLIGGNMSNMGNVTVEGESFFEIMNASRFWNKAGGVLDVKENGYVNNGSWIDNTGEITVEYGGAFENTLLLNDGRFQARNGSYLSESGVYYGEGEYDIAASDIKIYHTAYWDPDGLDRSMEVTSEDELVTAMETKGIEAVYMKSDITVHTDMAVRKNLFIDNGCSLTMADGAVLIDYGNVIMLKDGASLRGSNITLQEDAQLYMQYDSTLHLEENGELILDGSAIWGWGANIVLNDAAMSMKNRAAFGFNDLKSFKAYNSQITLQNKSMLAMPAGCDEEIMISGSKVTLSEEGGPSYFYTVTEADWKDCELHIGAGVFENRARNMNMQNCTITVAQDGTMHSDNSNLSFSGETTLTNEGNLFVWGWDEYLFTARGTITNYGNMEFGILHMDISVPIENQGTVYYNGDVYLNRETGWDDTCVTGNKPIDKSIQ